MAHKPNPLCSSTRRKETEFSPVISETISRNIHPFLKIISNSLAVNDRITRLISTKWKTLMYNKLFPPFIDVVEIGISLTIKASRYFTSVEYFDDALRWRSVSISQNYTWFRSVDGETIEKGTL